MYWLQVDETILSKVSDFLRILIVSVFTYIFSSISQNLINEDENLRNTLYECSWINKPEWFKKSLLIMLTRTNKPLQIKPFGLYVINLNSYATMMNAAYTYFNLLRSYKYVYN
ncbi:odorant receptor 10-like isoform X2 [Lycorma delicatula]|uniref:odorant receptor 10-like isoform X2 n=1 Tax=Lycorma delicatula TaxID=130591 RepID=UPI003F50DFA5